MKLSARLIKDARAAAGLTQAELARRAGTSQPTVAAYESGEKIPTVSTLERLLAAAGMSLVATRTSSRSRTKGLLSLLRAKRREIIELAAQHGAHNVRVFGSVARGEDDEVSDVDLIVDLEKGRSLLDQVRLQRALAEVLGIELDVITSGGLKEQDRGTILKDAIPV